MVDINNLSSDEKQATEELRTRVRSIIKQNMYEDTLLFYRFLKARDFDINKAEIMLQKHITWRKLYQVDTILEDFKPKEFFITHVQPSIMGFNTEGSLVVYIPVGKVEMKEILKCVEIQKYLKYWAWWIEKIIKYIKEQNESGETNVCRIVVILDLDKLTLSNATNKTSAEMFVNIINLFQDNYPEFMNAVEVINAPSYAVVVFNMVKHLMSKATLQKIHVFGNDGWKEYLFKTIDAEVLPAFLGGNRTDPDGDPLCKTFINHGGKIPPEYFLSDDERYLQKRPGVKRITIPQKEKKEIFVDVKELESVIRWEFYTKSNINFGLYRRLSDQPPEEVIPLSKYDTSDGSEKDSYKVRIPGKYIIVFDNSYGWFTSKEVEYSLEVLRREP